MNVAIDAPKRPALRYYGGKFNLAPWIISFFPPHQNYVEPCGGAASVLLQKPRSFLETYNDLNGDVVNFFRVLRDCPDELMRRIHLTPWARAEYELSLQPCREPVEWARRFFIMSWMAVAGQPSGWRRMNDYTKRRQAVAWDIHEIDLRPVTERFCGVQIENTDALRAITDYDNPDCLIYFDPPYVAETRSVERQYLIEVDDQFHMAAAELLRTAAGYVVISGYACPLYADLYERHGWQRHDKEAQTNSGGKRIESVWLSPRTVEALAKPKQAALW